VTDTPSAPDRGPTDAWAPAEIARRVEAVGVTKARADAASLWLLAVLAGAFIALGGALQLVVVADSTLGFGPTRWLSGFAFSLALILVVVAGAELFTGNNLIAMAWASRRIGWRELARNWALVYAGNVVGAVATATAFGVAGLDRLADGHVGEAAVGAAHAKAAILPPEALARGILCNALVCLAVWLGMGGRSVGDKVLGIVFPIAAFVALGLEHSIANWFFFPYAILLEGPAHSALWTGAFWNLVFVTLGNVIGGTFLVAGVYWFAYLRPQPDTS